MHPSRKAQIAHLKTDFADVFSSKLATELPEYEISNNVIELVDNWQLPYGPIYSLEPIELEILKAYIKNNLTNRLIKPFMSPAGVPFFFNKKPDGSLRLYMDYQGLNNLTVKYWYPLPLFKKLLEQLYSAQRFT